MISPLAYVDASAKLGANVTVHPFAYVDKNVEIGDDCEIMPHVSIMSGTRMGKRNRIFNGAVYLILYRPVICPTGCHCVFSSVSKDIPV